MKTNWADKLFDVISKLQKFFFIAMALFILGLGISSYGLPAGLFIGIIGAMLIIGTYALTGIWGVATDSLADFLDNYPNPRRNIIILFILFILFSAGYVVFYLDIDIIFKITLFIFFLLLLPSAIMSLVREDRRRESFKLLGNKITPTLISQNPQAAIEHAFTLFEDRLRKRLDVDASVYGENLVNLAFGKDGKLFYGETESENRGVRNLMAGAYATYRNPRKHRIVEDDKESALAIIALVELLIHIIDDASDKTE